MVPDREGTVCFCLLNDRAPCLDGYRRGEPEAADKNLECEQRDRDKATACSTCTDLQQQEMGDPDDMADGGGGGGGHCRRRR